MDGDPLERAAALVERETATAIESTRIVEQLTTAVESVLVLSVETSEGAYWVVDDDREASCYPIEAYRSADAALTEHQGGSW